MTAAEAARADPAPRLLTVTEYLDIGEIPSGYAELTEGRVTVVPSPTGDHNHAGAEIGWQLKPQLPADLEILLDMDVDLELVPPDQPGFCRRPDLIVVRRSARKRQRQDGGAFRASDVEVAMEIVSPSSRRTDRLVKRDEYADAGIPHYWILDLTEPVSLLVMHRAGAMGYAVSGEFTGRVAVTEPFPADLDLDALL